MVLAPPVEEIKRRRRKAPVLFSGVIALVLVAIVVGIAIGRSLTGSGKTASPPAQVGNVVPTTSYLAAGPHGDIYRTSLEGNQIDRILGGRQITARVLHPLGIAVGPAGAVYVAESRGCTINRYTANLQLISSIVTCSPRSEGYDGPGVLAIGPLHRIYATSQATSNIHIFSPAGSMVRAVNVGGSRMRFAGMAVNRSGTIYLTDAAMDRIISIPPSSNRSTIWGGYGTAPGQFRRPTQIAIDGAGNIYVLDAGNARIEKLSAACKPILSWGKNGSVRVSNPAGMTVNSRGEVFVTTGNGHVEQISPAGHVTAIWG
jgi:streptogramin lyase